jgi:hypothetical protein
MTGREIGHRAFDAELHRVRGENPAEARSRQHFGVEQAFEKAIAIAHQQSTRSFRLRASLSLAKLTNRQPARRSHAVLAHALEGFSPTPEMPEIAEAQAVLQQATARLLRRFDQRGLKRQDASRTTSYPWRQVGNSALRRMPAIRSQTVTSAAGSKPIRSAQAPPLATDSRQQSLTLPVCPGCSRSRSSTSRRQRLGAHPRRIEAPCAHQRPRRRPKCC